MYSRLLVLPALLLLLGADDPATDAKKLEGTWKIVTFETSRKQPTEEDLQKGRVVFQDGMMILRGTGKEEKGTVKLDPTKKPKEMDLAVNDGKETALFIYEIDGDNLKLCWRKPGGGRPTTFTGKDNSGYMVLKREKKD